MKYSINHVTKLIGGNILFTWWNTEYPPLFFLRKEKIMKVSNFYIYCIITKAIHNLVKKVLATQCCNCNNISIENYILQMCKSLQPPQLIDWHYADPGLGSPVFYLRKEHELLQAKTIKQNSRQDWMWDCSRVGVKRRKR